MNTYSAQNAAQNAAHNASPAPTRASARISSGGALLRDERGAAMAEGVIVLPLFILVLAAILYFHRGFAAKLDASVQARSCAWAYSIGGCMKNASIPDGCNISTIGDGEDALSSISSDTSLDAETRSAFGKKSSDGSAVTGALEGASAVGRALLGLREGIVARPSRTIDVSSLMGGGTMSVSGDYSVMCNERNWTPTEIAVEAYCSLSSSLPGC